MVLGEPGFSKPSLAPHPLPAPLGRDGEPEKGARDMDLHRRRHSRADPRYLVLSEDDNDSATAVNLTDLVAAIQAMAVEHG